MRRVKALLVIVLASTAPTLVPASVGAQSSREVEKASQVLRLNREAMELFESLDFELARKQLLEALEVGRKAGLDTHSVMAKTHGNLGLLYAVGLKDEAKAVDHFKKALAIRSDYRVAKELASPDVDAIFSRAQKELSEGKPVDPSEAAAEAASSGSGSAEALRCPTAGEVNAGDDITLRCVTSGGLQPTSVVLFYKRSGEDEFTSVVMKAPAPDAKKATWSAKIPGRDVAGSWLPFYFEARNGSGNALAMSGRNDSPNIITIRGGEDAPVARKKARPAARRDAEGDDENPLAKFEKHEEGVIERTWFLGLGLGSGAGYAGGDGIEAYRNSVRGFTPGFAPAALAHATPELGYHVTPTIALTLQGRVQYRPRDTNETASGAFLVLARALFYTGEGSSRFYGALSAGGGDGFRLQVEARRTVDNTVVKDTVRGGPVVAGVGGGYSYDLSDSFAWMIETNVLAGFPSFSAVIDINTGIRAVF